MARTFQKPAEDGDFIPAPEGTGAAVLTVLAFLGLHESTWQGKPRTRELVGLSYELADRSEDGRALAVNEVVSVSFSEKAKLYARIKALCGGREPPEGWDLAKLLGRPCLVTVVHSERDGYTYANVEAVSPMPRGMQAVAPSVQPVYFDVNEADAAIFDLLPARFRKLAEVSLPPSAAVPNTAPAAAHSPAAPRPAPSASAAPQSPAKPAPPPDLADFDDDIPF